MSEGERRPLLIERPIVVRTYDIDFANIVHNIVYFRWLEDLRSEVLADVLPIDEILTTGISPILTAGAIEYKWPVRIGDAAIGRMWVAELSRTRWTLAAEIVVGGRVCAAARQSGYFADFEDVAAGACAGQAARGVGKVVNYVCCYMGQPKSSQQTASSTVHNAAGNVTN